MKLLIINADDLGINNARSHGIFQAFEQGVVRSATLICNGSHAATAAKWARERKLATGLHLNLTDGFPMSTPDDVRTLLRPNGEFYDRDELERQIRENMVDPVHIEREIRTQLEWFYDSHGQPTHVDGHHHVHIHPAVIPLLTPILDRYGIGFVRIPSEPLPPHGFEISPEHLRHTQAISDRADAARILFAANGIRSTDIFRGLALAGHASKRNLRHIFSRLPADGSLEIMVHPGSPASEGTPFDLDPQRQTELNMLVDPEAMELATKNGFTLGSYADLF